MPRTARSTESRLSTVPKRNARRNASKQQSLYEDVELSPGEKSDKIDKSCDYGSLADPTESPATNVRERSMSSSSTAIPVVSEASPTRKALTAIKESPSVTQKSTIPGLDALEAVNSLYQRLKDSHSEVDLLTRQNSKLSLDLQKQKKTIDGLQGELKLERERYSKAQRSHEKEIQKLRQTTNEDLIIMVKSLHHFSSAAGNLMPLLDVLAGSGEVRYDETTERLNQIFTNYKSEDSP